MKNLGTVLHATEKNTVVVPAASMVAVYSRVYDYKGRELGKVIDVFGSVKKPYLLIAPKKGVRITELIGKEIYGK